MHEISTDPFLDWLMILGVSIAVALVLVGAGVSVYLDSRARIQAPLPAPGHKQALPLDREALEKVRGIYADRAGERSAILRRWDFPADPSLP